MSIDLSSRETQGIAGAIIFLIALLFMVYTENASGELIIILISLMAASLGISFNEFRKRDS